MAPVKDRAPADALNTPCSTSNPLSPASNPPWAALNSPPPPSTSPPPLPSQTSPDAPAPTEGPPSIPLLSLPAAPKLEGDALLEVFVHKSMRFPGATVDEDSPYVDGPRLAALGQAILHAVYTEMLFRLRPTPAAEDFPSKIENEIKSLVKEWVDGYGWRVKVRHHPSVNIHTEAESRLLFETYAGAVYVDRGYEALRAWVWALANPRAPLPTWPKAEALSGNGSYQAPAATQLPGSWAPAAAPVQRPEPFVASPAIPASVYASALPQQAASNLSLFNQIAQQRRIVVEYPAHFSGPEHAGRWHVKCLVNGSDKGYGTGASKQAAKEEAARQALYTMGWVHE
ncbi:hypothetical protein OH77DRAFT_1486438 [Trametes cingulata]|nr:hypothetical protein OH77DRAFT_1486438 [Trametes cingulata]